MTGILLTLLLALWSHGGGGGGGGGVWAQTTCDQQLYNYYVQKGLNPLFPIQPTINYTTGTLGDGTPYVTASYNMQTAAEAYQFNISNMSVPFPVIFYTSFDLPWCATDVHISCAAFSQFAMGKVCENVLDIDTGPPSQIVGRFFVYVNNSVAACNGGIVNVTFINTTLLATFTDNVIYSANGLTNFTALDFNDAQFQYRYTECAYTDGTNATYIDLQGQFVCRSQTIGCSVPRPAASSIRRMPIPAPRYACYNNTVTYSGPNNTPTLVSEYINWFVYSYQPVGGPEGLFRIDFIDASGLQNYYNGIYNPFNNALCGFIDFLNFWLSLFHFPLIYRGPCIKQILVPSTRRQFQVKGLDFASYMLINAGSGGVEEWFTTVITPTFRYSTDPIIEIVPCICEFSMDCLPTGEPDLNNLYHYINPSNQRPLAGVNGQNAYTIPAGTPNITLNSNASHDPDNGPLGLSFFWRSYNITRYVLAPTSGIPVVSIANVTAPVTTADTGSLAPGFYIILLYVSDGQDISYTTLNFTVAINIITAVAGNDMVVDLTQCTPSTPAVCITLNGTLSHQTANFTLHYNWTLLYGWPLSPGEFNATCGSYDLGIFNWNESLACFIPKFLGLYEFQLTVTDNMSATATDTVFVSVVAPGSNLTITNNTFATFPPLDDHSNPPIDRPVYGFPSAPTVPFTDAPFAPNANPPVNTNVTPPLPNHWPPTTNQWINLTAALFGAIIFLVMFTGLWIKLMPENEMNYLDRMRFFTNG